MPENRILEATGAVSILPPVEFQGSEARPRVGRKRQMVA